MLGAAPALRAAASFAHVKLEQMARASQPGGRCRWQACSQAAPPVPSTLSAAHVHTVGYIYTVRLNRRTP